MTTQDDAPLFVYVGAYTGPGKAEGISVFRMGPATGALAHAQTLTGIENPTFLARHPQQPYLYAVSEVGNGDGQSSGVVSAFAIEPATGSLILLNHQDAHGTGSCHLSMDPSLRHLLVANYTSGSLAVFPIQDDGQLGQASDVVQHVGRGPDPNRQAGPHAHYITMDPTGQYVLACDLGLDRVMVYRLDGSSGKLIPGDLPYAQVASGAGPRHLAFHPNGRFVYVINELDSTLVAFAYDATRGALQVVQTVSTLPEDFTGVSNCAHVLVASSGKFVYGSNRGHDSIAIFAADEATGRLTALGHQPTLGRTPRNFAIDPSGTFVLAANQDTNTIVTFRLNPATGSLTHTGHVADSPAPVCLVFGPR